MECRESAESKAAEWIARREGDDWCEADQIELDAWIQADTSNRVAWLRMNSLWQQTARLKLLVTSAAVGSVPSPHEMHLPFLETRSERMANEAFDALPTSRGTRAARKPAALVSALAASLALAVVAATAWYFIPRGPLYETEIGALQSVPLSDGSRVTLNTNTALRVGVTHTERHIELKQGEAYFEVAKDPSRPFVVDAGEQRVVAIGTRFSVRREGNEVRVVVSEGRVRVEQKAQLDHAASEINEKQAATLLAAGSVARAIHDDILVLEKSTDEVDRLLSWRVGRLVFENTLLADAAAEFNRYNTRKIVIDDTAVAAIRVGGSFSSSNVEGFLRLIASDFPITVTQRDDEIIVNAMPPH